MLTTLKEMGKGTLGNQTRKVLMYVMIGVCIILSVLAITNIVQSLYLKSKVKNLQTQIEATNAANESLSKSVENISKLREIDSDVLASLSSRLGRELARDSDLRSKLAILEATNETARAYLDAPVHPDVALLLQTNQDGENSIIATEISPRTMSASTSAGDRKKP